MNHHSTYNIHQKQWTAPFRMGLIRLLLLGYMLMMLKPVMPLLADHLAHKYWKGSHYQLVHKHDGNAHVHKEISKLVQDGQKEKPASKIKCEVSDIYFIVNTPTLSLSKHPFVMPVYGYTPHSYSLLYQDIPYQPPRC